MVLIMKSNNFFDSIAWIYDPIRKYFFGEHGRKRASELQGGRTPYFIADLSARDTSFNPIKYIGKVINNTKYKKLLNVLTEKKAFDRTKFLIKTHLNYGSEIIKQNLMEQEFNALDSLRETIEESVDRLV